jgi:hypothetical protein
MLNTVTPEAVNKNGLEVDIKTMESNFDNVSVTSYGQENYTQAKLSDILSLHADNLVEDAFTQAIQFAKWVAISNTAKRDAVKAYRNRKMIAAKLADFARSAEGLTAQGKKTTEATVESFVLTHSEYQLALRQEIESQYVADLYAGVVEGFKQRHELLISLLGREKK